jgi:hypothetical protein
LLPLLSASKQERALSRATGSRNVLLKNLEASASADAFPFVGTVGQFIDIVKNGRKGNVAGEVLAVRKVKLRFDELEQATSIVCYVSY